MRPPRTILFVDDEPHVLEGLKRSLHAHRKDWHMLFACGGEEALAVMEKDTIDVVVTDMRMPGMDGASLLERVHTLHPDVMRIVLSGQFDVEAGMRAVPVAHQFLMKPCDPERLKAAIACASNPNSFLADEATKRVISAVGALPSPPKTCTALLNALNHPETSLAAITQIVHRDVALTAKVLQLVNSAFFSLPHEISDVKSALTVLGFDVLKQLVLSAEILKQFRPAQPIPGFSMDDFEQHSRLAAKIADLLPTEPASKNLRMMTALLHDVGKLLLASQLPKKFTEACRYAAVEDCPLYKAERTIFGTSHAEIGAFLLNLWGLPQPAIDAIASHHRPLAPAGGESAPFDLCATVHIANALAHDPGPQPDGEETPLPDLDPAYVDSLGVTALLPQWRAAAREIAGRFQLET